MLPGLITFLVRAYLLPYCCWALATFGQPAVEPADLALLRGNWSGELYYMDYSDGSPVTIPATLLVLPLEGRSWIVGHGYPNEPHAHELDTMALSADGRQLDGSEVMEVRHFGADSVRMVLEENGTDDDMPARLRRTWTYGPRRCTMRREARRTGGTEFTLRHEYRLERYP